MSPPRRPKGESPQTTIRYLRRQIDNLLQELISWKIAGAERNKQIAQQDVELSEAADRERILIDQVEDGADAHGRLLAAHQRTATRLAFLEGYYDKSKELAVSEALLAHDPAETNRGSSAGNTGNLPGGTQTPKEEGLEAAPHRPGGGPRGEIRGFRPHNPAYSDRRSMAEFEVGPVQDRSRGNPIVENDI